MTNPHTPIPSSQDRYPGMQRVRAGDQYPAGLNFQPVPPQDGADEPAPKGRCNFELIIRGSCIDDPKAREAIRKAVERALDPEKSASIKVQEAKVDLGAVVMKS